MANVLASENLQRKFVATLADHSSWSDIWRLLLQDPWFRAELSRHSEFVVRTSGHSLQLADDVQQEVIVHLPGALQRSVQFGHDPSAIGDKFPSWIGTIVLNECRDALRRLHAGRELPIDQSSEHEEATALAVSRLQDQVRALQLAIEDLSEPQSTVLRLFLAGHSICSIAKLMKVSYKQAYAAFRSGIDQLRQDLT